MKEQLITFETAKLAKEKGFNIPVNNFYAVTKELWKSTKSGIPTANYNLNKSGELTNSKLWYRYGYSAPTQSLLEKWLLETHNISIELTFDEGQWFIYVGVFSYPDSSIGLVATIECSGFKDAIKQKPIALEKGLQEALTLIK